MKIWGEISFKQVSKTIWEGIQYNLIVSLSFEGKSQPPKTPICRILHGNGYEKGQKPKKQIAKIFSFWELQELEVRPNFPHVPHFWQNWLLTKLTAGMIQLFFRCHWLIPSYQCKHRQGARLKTLYLHSISFPSRQHNICQLSTGFQHLSLAIIKYFNSSQLTSSQSLPIPSKLWQSQPRQHCRLTICIELVELTNSVRWQIVSDDKIQITILILRRGALSI